MQDAEAFLADYDLDILEDLTLLNPETGEKKKIPNSESEQPAEHYAYVWQWIDSGYFFSTHPDNDQTPFLDCAKLFYFQKEAQQYADILEKDYPREKARLVKIGIIN